MQLGCNEWTISGEPEPNLVYWITRRAQATQARAAAQRPLGEVDG